MACSLPKKCDWDVVLFINGNVKHYKIKRFLWFKKLVEV